MAIWDEFTPLLPSVISNLPQAVLVVDQDYVVHYMNDRAVRMFGYARGELKSVKALLPGSFRERFCAHISAAISQSQIEGMEGDHVDILGRRKNGVEFPAEVWASHLAVLGRPMAIVLITDITNRIPNQWQIESYVNSAIVSSEIFSVLDLLDDYVVVLDKHWQYIFANRAVLESLNRPKSEILGKSYWHIFPELVGTPIDTALRSAFSKQKKATLEYYNPQDQRWYRVDIIPSQSSLTVRSVDITEERHSRILTDQLMSTLDNLGDPIMVIDRQWRNTFANQAACRYLGRQRDQMLGRNVWELFPKVIGTSFETAYRNAMESSTPTVWEDYYPPRDVWFKNSFFPTSDGIIVHTIDVTEHRRNQRRVQELQSMNSEADMLEAFSVMQDPVIIMDSKLRFLYLNAAALGVNHRRAEDVIGKYLTDIENPIIGDRLINGVTQAANTGQRDRFEFHFERVNKWFQIDLFPTRERVIVHAVDITKLKQSEKSISILTDALEQAMDSGWNRQNARDTGKGRR